MQQSGKRQIICPRVKPVLDPERMVDAPEGKKWGHRGTRQQNEVKKETTDNGLVGK